MSILVGLGWHFLGSMCAAAFYAPISRVKSWSWETTWALAGSFSWILLPWFVSFFLIDNFSTFYGQLQARDVLGMLFFGAMWGVGNVNYGLAMRHLGMSLGIGIAIGTTLIFGTLIPPMFKGTFFRLFTTQSGLISFFGLLVALAGIAVVSYAGHLKEKVLKLEIQDFDLKKGILLAVMCGFFSAGFAFGLEFADNLQKNALSLGVNPLFSLLPSYGIIMGGGAIINFGYCFLGLAFRSNLSLKKDLSQPRGDLVKNALLAISGGVMWYLQFFFYGWGESNIPKDLSFLNWMLHMSMYVFGGGVVGILLSEWKGVGVKPIRILIFGMFTIIVAANLVGLSMALTS